MQSNNLLTKLKIFAKDAKKKSKQNIDLNSSFSTLTDEEITIVLAHRAKKLRIHNNLKQSQFSKSAKLSSPTTYSNFEQSGKVSLINFVKIVRAFGKMSELEKIFKSDISSIIDDAQNSKKERLRVS